VCGVFVRGVTCVVCLCGVCFVFVRCVCVCVVCVGSVFESVCGEFIVCEVCVSVVSCVCGLCVVRCVCVCDGFIDINSMPHHTITLHAAHYLALPQLYIYSYKLY
jgi:hypothetical protein